ncbi:retropepsin-like aspartic protease [Myroides sp. LJL119]
MEKLQELLKLEGYKKVKFKISKTQHLFIRAKINGKWGDFILDSGASNSCIDFDYINEFNVIASHSKTRASGAGANNMFTQASYNNQLQLGRWKLNDFHFIVMDLSHVNTALTQYKTKNVHGIIGADILIQAQAIIDYKSLAVYLK